MIKPTIVFFGTPSFVIPVLRKLFQDFEVVAVVTTPDAPQGRHRVLTPSAIKQFVQENHKNIPVFTPEKLDEEAKNNLEQIKPDLSVVAAYGKIIPQTILDIPTYGSINIHPSLLPKYRGTSPIQTMLLHGDKESGVTIMLMDDKMDHGPILLQWKIEISKEETFESLHKSMFEDAAEKLPGVIRDFLDNKISPIPQDDTQATYCEKIARESGYFEINNPPWTEKLNNMIRAFYPWPGVWTRLHQDYGGQALKGKIIKFYPEGKIQMEGKKVVDLGEFLNGYPQLRQQLEQLLPKE